MAAAPLPALALERAAQVRDAAADELDLLLADLTAWVSHDSPSDDVAALDALAAELAAACVRDGLEVELVPAPSGRHLHAWCEGRGRARVALLGHHDTVFPH